MTLTKDGYLGIGITNPDRPFQSVGNAKIDGQLLVTGDSQFDQDVIIYRGITFNNDSNNGVSTAYQFDILNDFNVSGNSVFTGTVDLPDNVTIANLSGISTFATLDVLTNLNLLQTDFNHNTQTGISTYDNLSILGAISFNSAQNIDIVNISGVSTFFGLEVSQNLSIGGTTTTQDFQCNVADATIGVSTFIDLNLTGGLDTGDRIYVGSSVSMTNDLFVGGIATVTGSLEVGGDVTFNATSGISTLFDLDVVGSLTVGTSLSCPSIENPVAIGDTITIGSVGSGFTFSGSSLDAVGGVSIRIGRNPYVAGDPLDQGSIGFATEFPVCAVDVGLRTDSYILPPKVTTTDRDYNTSIPNRVVSGALIYNSTLNKMQFYNGSAWETITSS
jgi:hypothetical protein